MKDEALKLVMEFLDTLSELHLLGHDGERVRAVIKQALAAPVQEPVAWKWHQAPVKTSWGHEMVVTDLAIDKDNTVSVYCERDQTTKVEAMFTPPIVAAPLAAPDKLTNSDGETPEYVNGWNDCRQLMMDMIRKESK